MERLIEILLTDRTVAHAAHLRTGSYAAHMALGGFYDAVGGHADAIAEAYQGRYLRLLNVNAVAAETPDDMVAYLQGRAQEIERVRYEASSHQETTIQNLIDDALATYYSAIYKLAFLH